MRHLILFLCILGIPFQISGQDIISAEYFWDIDPGVGQATPIALTASDTINDDFTISIPPNLGFGAHLLYVRVKDADGTWGITRTNSYFITSQADLVKGEYFWDNDPGIGMGTPFTFAPNDTINQVFNFDVPPTLSIGQHSLYVRVQQDDGSWSIARANNFINKKALDIVAAEYYWDNDPGFGMATPLPLSNDSTYINESYNIDISALDAGLHVLVARVLSEGGLWSIISTKEFNISKPIYVDSTGTGLNNGSSWVDAFTDLKDAIDATADTIPALIRVAQGTYFPDEGTMQRDSTFDIKQNTTILGGYPAGGDTDANRDWVANPVILSGDIGVASDNIDNSYHVVTTTAVGDLVFVDGIIIENGNANGGGAEDNAGGWLNDGKPGLSNPTIKNTIFRNNTALDWGGAMFNDAIGANAIASPNYENCTFENNYAGVHGGAFLNFGGNSTGVSSPSYTNCIFAGNTANTAHGGALLNDGFNGLCEPTFINCLFHDNSGVLGGAMSNFGAVSTTITNCTFAQNNSGNGEHILSTVNAGTPSTTVINSVFDDTGNNGDIFSFSGGSLDLSYSIIDGPLPAGTTDSGNNIYSTDPQFLDPANDDFIINVNSPAANSGNNSANTTATDLAGNLRIQNVVIDRGAYEVLTDNCLITYNAFGSCAGGTTIFTGDTIFTSFTNLNGNGPFTITINGVPYSDVSSGDTIVSFVEGVDFSGTAPYTFDLEFQKGEDQSGNCVTTMDTVTITFTVQNQVMLNVDDGDGFYCEGQTVNYNVTPSGLSNYEFFDDIDNDGELDMGESLQDGASNLYSMSMSTVGYMPNIKCLAGEGSCLTISNAISGEVVANPTAAISFMEMSGLTFDDGNMCYGDTLTLMGSGGTSYSWNTGSSAASFDVAVDDNSSFTLTVTDANGCTDESTYTPNVDPDLVLNLLQLEDISCFGEVDGLIEVSGSGGVGGYTYDMGGGPQGSGIFNGLAEDTYSITLTDTNTCEEEMDYIISEPGELQASASTSPELCYNDSTGTITINLNGGTSPFQYDIGNGNQGGNIFSSLTFGAYSVTVTDNRGCMDTVMASVSGFDSLEVAITQQQNATCNVGSADGSITFSAIGGSGGYLFDIGSGFTSNPAFTNLSAGQYTLTFKDSNNCTETLDFTIGSESLSASITYTGNPKYVSEVVFPTSSSQFVPYRFEINYVDPNNELPQPGYPRLFLDYEGNGIYTDPLDKIYILSEDDNTDTDVTDGKIYYVNATALEVSSDWQAYFIAQDANGCEATFGPVDGPDVLAKPNLYLFASDISFSEVNPDKGEFFNVFANIYNNGSFDAENFKVGLYNEYTESLEATIMIPLLEAGESTSIFWDVQAVNEDAYVPYRVEIDIDEVIEESFEGDNTAAKGILIGDYMLPVEISFLEEPMFVPQTGYPLTERLLTGVAVYTGLPGTPQDSTVKGAEINIVIDETGESFTGYTNNQGEFSFNVLAPPSPGTYEVSGYITDFSLTTSFTPESVVVVGNPGGCNKPDLAISHTINKLVLNVGDTLVGTFKVQNLGCVATGQNVELVATFPNANEMIGPFIIENLDIGEDTILNWFATYSSEGNILFSAHVDANLVLDEIEEGNNYTSQSLAVANKSNLVAPLCYELGLTPTNPAGGQLVDLAFPIRNDALVANTKDFQVLVEVGVDSFYQTITEDIAAGEIVETEIQITLPNDLNQLVKITIDPENEVGEKYEDDNVFTTDLCGDLSLVPSYLPPGQSQFWQIIHPTNAFVDIKMDVNVSGLIQFGSVNALFEVMGPGFPVWTNIGNETINMAGKNCGAQKTIAPTIPFAFPQEGTYQIRISVDFGDLLDECDEFNNQVIHSVEVENIPDLKTLSAFINPSELNPDPNESITFDVTFQNLGSENLSDQFDFKVAVDGMDVETQQVNGLPANGQATVSFNQSWSSGVVGGHIIEAFIDSGEEITEINETNNEATRAIIVGTAPNLYFVDFKPSDTIPQFGDEILVQALIGNDGDLACSSTLELFYLEDNGDTTTINSKLITVESMDTVQFSFSYVVDRPETYVFGRILPGTPSEYNLVDNEAQFFLVAGNPPCNLVVYNTLDSGEGSLRQCIECANESDDFKTISFDIPGAGPHVINVLTPLPFISGDSTQIDGSTQPGNFPMAGEVIVDLSPLTGLIRTGLTINCDNSGIYGLQFRNTNLFGKVVALSYALSADSCVIGDSLRGNWFLDDKWETVIFFKENINKGVIHGNIFDSDSLRMKNAIVINSGDNRMNIGGDSLWMRNTFKGCTGVALELRNGSNENRIVNNLFIGNETAIFNNADLFGGGGVNNGNLYLGNQFSCNTNSIVHAPTANNMIGQATIENSKTNFVNGTADPNTIVQLYYSPDTCQNSVACQGEMLIATDSVGIDGEFLFVFKNGFYLEQGGLVSVIQTDTIFNGSSVFSTCAVVDSNCVDFVYTSEDMIIGSLRSAVECAADGDTILFLNYLTGSSVLLDEKIDIDKDLTIQGLGNPGLSVVSMSDEYLIQIDGGKTVVIKELILCVNDTGADAILRNLGDLDLENVSIIDKRSGLPQNFVLNTSGASLNVKGTVQILKQ